MRGDVHLLDDESQGRPFHNIDLKLRHSGPRSLVYFNVKLVGLIENKVACREADTTIREPLACVVWIFYWPRALPKTATIWCPTSCQLPTDK